MRWTDRFWRAVIVGVSTALLVGVLRYFPDTTAMLSTPLLALLSGLVVAAVDCLADAAVAAWRPQGRRR